MMASGALIFNLSASSNEESGEKQKVRGPGRVTDFQTVDCGSGFLPVSSAGTGGRIRGVCMTRRTILFSGNQYQSQNNVNSQDAVEGARSSHRSLLGACLVLLLYLPYE